MRLHLLKHLKNYGAPKHDLVNFYKSIIRPVLEYGDVLWTGGITVNHIYSGITYKLGESTETCNENYIPGIDLWTSFRVVQYICSWRKKKPPLY